MQNTYMYNCTHRQKKNHTYKYQREKIINLKTSRQDIDL